MEGEKVQYMKDTFVSGSGYFHFALTILVNYDLGIYETQFCESIENKVFELWPLDLVKNEILPSIFFN